MAPRPSLEALEKLAPEDPPFAIALVGEDGYLVAHEAARLLAAWEKSGCEIRPFDGGPSQLADELRSGSLFGGGVVFVAEDPDWLVGTGGDGKRRLTALLKAIREGKPNAEKRVVETLTGRGLKWSPDSPAEAREALAAWLSEIDAGAEDAATLRSALDGAIASRVEAASGGEGLSELESGLENVAPGNRLLLRLTARPKKTSPGAPLMAKIAEVAIALPAGRVHESLRGMAELAAKEAGVRFGPGALASLLARTAPPEKPDPRDKAEPSIRLFRTELDKLLAAAGPGGLVDAALVSSLVEDASTAKLWDLDELLGARRAGEAVALVRKLLSRKGSGTEGEALMLQGYLAALFRRMVTLHDRLGPRIAQAGGGGFDAWKRAWFPRLADLVEKGKSEFPLFRATSVAAAYSAAEAEQALRRLAAIDRSAKTGGPPVSEQLEAFLAATVPKRGAPARRRGFSLIEVVVGFAILALVLTSGITLFTWQQRRQYEQTLWRRAIESVEEEAETNRAAVPASIEAPGNGKFLTMQAEGQMPESMMWLIDPIATRKVEMVGEDPRLLSITLALSWQVAKDSPRRVRYEEVVVVAK